MLSWHKIARRIRVPLGFAFAAAYLWLATPTVRSLLVGCCIAGIGLLVRGLASGHVTKNEQLTMTGPYAYTRNPLYLGSLIIALGFAIASRSWLVVVIAVTFLFAIYLPVIRSEEEFLRTRFPEFDQYSRNVPRLFPRFRPFRSSASSFSWHLYWKHREYNAALGSALIVAALLLKPFIRVLWRAR
jgi:protein-S-isoprenylcysteine O-methyltransferase Ste14